MNKIPSNSRSGEKMLTRALDRIPKPLLVVTLLAFSNLVGLTLMTAENPTVRSIVQTADCYDRTMGAMHPLNNCSRDNPLINKLREVKSK